MYNQTVTKQKRPLKTAEPRSPTRRKRQTGTNPGGQEPEREQSEPIAFYA